MAVTPYNLVLGPATVYAGAFGTTEPTDASITPSPGAPGAGWTDVGGTDGGVMFEIDGTYTDLHVDQIIMNVGSRLTDLNAMVTTQLSEQTQANLQVAMNSIMTLATGSGYATADLQVTSAATQPTYAGIIIDGWAPTLVSGAAARRRVIVRKVLSTPKVKLTYDRKTQGSYDVVFNAFYVSSSIVPVHIVDQTA